VRRRSEHEREKKRTAANKKEHAYRGKLAHERSQNRAGRTCDKRLGPPDRRASHPPLDDEPSLIADPPHHTPPRLTPNSPPASRTFRLTSTVSRLSERKEDGTTCAIRFVKQKRADKQACAETDQVRGHAQRHIHNSIHGGAKGKQRKRIQQGTKADLSTTSNPNKALARTYTYSHTPKFSTIAAQEEQRRCGGWRWLGPRRRRTVRAGQRQVNWATHAHGQRGESVPPILAVIAMWRFVRPGITAPMCVQFLSCTTYLHERASAPPVRT